MDITIHLLDPHSKALIKFLSHREGCTHAQTVRTLIFEAVRELRIMDQDLDRMLDEFMDQDLDRMLMDQDLDRMLAEFEDD